MRFAQMIRSDHQCSFGCSAVRRRTAVAMDSQGDPQRQDKSTGFLVPTAIQRRQASSRVPSSAPLPPEMQLPPSPVRSDPKKQVVLIEENRASIPISDDPRHQSTVLEPKASILGSKLAPTAQSVTAQSQSSKSAGSKTASKTAIAEAEEEFSGVHHYCNVDAVTGDVPSAKKASKKSIVDQDQSIAGILQKMSGRGRMAKERTDENKGNRLEKKKSGSDKEESTQSPETKDEETVSRRIELQELQFRRQKKSMSAGKFRSGSKFPASKVSKKEKPKSRCTRRCVCIAIAVLLTSVVIIGGIGLGIYALLNRKEDPTELPVFEGKAKTFYDGICGVFPLDDQECMIGSAPTASCQSGTCHRFRYAAEAIKISDSVQWKFIDRSVSKRITSACPEGILCQLGNGSRLGVCSSQGQCDRVYNGEYDPMWFTNGTWEDNCDVPNPCWQVGSMEWSVGDRQDWKAGVDMARCEAGLDAIVWLQHLRCRVGRNRTAAGSCEGLPLRLWRIAHCNNTASLCNSSIEIKSFGQCVFACESNLHRKLVMPTGARCQLENDATGSVEAYCYMGTCLKAELMENASVIMDKSDCEQQKKKA